MLVASHVSKFPLALTCLLKNNMTVNLNSTASCIVDFVIPYDSNGSRNEFKLNSTALTLWLLNGCHENF